MQDFNKFEDPNQQSFNNWQEFDYREGFGIRLGMFLIDSVAYFLLFVLIMIPTGLLNQYMALDWNLIINQNNAEMQTYLALSEKSNLISIPVYLVFILMDIFFGATPAKLMLNRRIANASRRPAERKVLLIRASVKWGFHFFTILSLISSLKFLSIFGSIYAFVIFFGGLAMLSHKKQALHDFAAKTAVYHVDDIIYQEHDYNNQNYQG